jgi:hypothetical protein
VPSTGIGVIPQEVSDLLHQPWITSLPHTSTYALPHRVWPLPRGALGAEQRIQL